MPALPPTPHPSRALETADAAATRYTAAQYPQTGGGGVSGIVPPEDEAAGTECLDRRDEAGRTGRPGRSARSDRPDWAEFRRNAGLPGVELYRARIDRLAFAPHVHDAYGIGAVASGGQRFRYRGVEHVAPAGSLVRMQPDRVHTGQPATGDPWCYAMVYVAPSVLPELLAGFPEAAGTSARPPRDGDIRDVGETVCLAPDAARLLLHAVERLWNEPDPRLWRCLLAEALHACLLPPAATSQRDTRRSRAADPAWIDDAGRATAASADSPSHPDTLSARLSDSPWADPRLAAVRDHIEAHFDTPVSVADMARAAGLSLFHFLRVFRAAIGATPHEYLQARRVAAAMALLAAGQAPAQAALATGFTDQSHLNRWLYRTHGTTPGRYRQQFRTR